MRHKSKLTLRLITTTALSVMCLFSLLIGPSIPAKGSPGRRPQPVPDELRRLRTEISQRAPVRMKLYCLPGNVLTLTDLTPEMLRQEHATTISDAAVVRRETAELSRALTESRLVKPDGFSDFRYGCDLYDKQGRPVGSISSTLGGERFAIDGKEVAVKGPLFRWLRHLIEQYHPRGREKK